MQSIKRTYADNIGGSTRLLFVPHGMVDKDNFPLRVPNSMHIEDDIELLNDAAWFFMDCVRESIDAPSENKRDSGGSTYNHRASGFVSGDDILAAVQLDAMTHQRFLALRKDANGHWCLLGNIREPLKFSFKKQPKNKVTGLKGFDFEFYGTCSLPELYYYGNINVSTPDEEEELIPATPAPVPVPSDGISPMRSITRMFGDNMGGSTRLLYIPHHLVDKNAWPDRIVGGLYIEDDIELLTDQYWFFIDCVRESIDAPSENKRDGGGSTYNHRASGFVAGDDMTIAAQLDAMTHQRFLALRKDANGHWCLLGNIREPLKFSFKKQPKNKVTGLKGFDFEFYGTCSLPELYYYGSITYVAPDETTELIPGTAIPTPVPRNGWSPVLAVVINGSERVLCVIDWVNGYGVKPDTGLYVGPTGLVSDIDEAVNVRGAVVTQIPNVTIDVGDWTLVGEVYEAEIVNGNITSNTIVDVVPDDDSYDAVIEAEIFPKTDSYGGVVVIRAKNLPLENINITLNLLT